MKTLDPRQILQPTLLEGVVNKKLEAQLDFHNMFPTVPTDALGFTYFQDTTSAGDDISNGVQAKPSPLLEVGELDEIEMSPIQTKSGIMERYGYELKFSKRQLRQKEVVDEISRGVDRAVFGISRKRNDDIANVIKNINNDVTEAGGYKVWSDPEATPNSDILSFVKASKIEGYPYQLNNLYLHNDNYFELLDYVQNVDINWVQSPFQSDIKIPNINGVMIHNAMTSQINEGSYIGTDSRYPGISIYEYLDPDHSKIEGSHVNVNVIEEEKSPYNTVVEIYTEIGIAPKLPNSLYYKSSAI